MCPAATAVAVEAKLRWLLVLLMEGMAIAKVPLAEDAAAAAASTISCTLLNTWSTVCVREL